MFKKTLVVLVLLFTFVSSNVLATGEPATTSEINEEPETQVGIQNAPKRIYITNIRRSFSKQDYHLNPPPTIPYSKIKNGLLNRGNLTRVRYADADTRWLAYYSGYIDLVQ